MKKKSFSFMLYLVQLQGNYKTNTHKWFVKSRSDIQCRQYVYNKKMHPSMLLLNAHISDYQKSVFNRKQIMKRLTKDCAGAVLFTVNLTVNCCSLKRATNDIRQSLLRWIIHELNTHNLVHRSTLA